MTDLRSCCQQALLDHYPACSASRPVEDGPVPAVRVTRYEVSCVPETHPDASLFTIVVEYRGEGRWAVTQRGAYYDADGNRSWGSEWPGGKEPVTDEEIAAANQAHDDWLARHRFDEKTACALAARLAPGLHYRGYTVADALAQESPRTDPDVPGTVRNTSERSGTETSDA